MKITKNDLKRIILETLNEAEGEQLAPKDTSRTKKIGASIQAGGTMSVDEYETTLKTVLLAPTINDVNRKAALEKIFPAIGNRINNLIKQAIEKQQGEPQ
jgi:F0F1-type ATP synthase delta subunit